jgi:hypothetical protein
MTSTVAEELSQEHQQFIVDFIYSHYTEMDDYLQVFEFYVKNNKQFLIQRQEEPRRKINFYMELKDSGPINRTVWVMDNHDHIILLFPEDY